jgi:glycerol-3-phosphate dehydrogenase (NAD(P)+)
MSDHIEMSYPIAMLGAGSWGTSVAIHLAKHYSNVYLWGHDINKINHYQQHHTNTDYLPHTPFPSSLTLTSDITSLPKNSLFIIATPSHAFIETFLKLPQPITQLAWLTKGLVPETATFFSSYIDNLSHGQCETALITGPSFAKEVAEGQPTALTIATTYLSFGKQLQNLFHHHPIRTYLTEDIKGAELASTVKNIIAIAAGISDGLGFGANARAALITRGLSEMVQLGIKLGGKTSTFMGLAGIGDLVLTATDDTSRNRRFGRFLGEGHTAIEAEHLIQQSIEGKLNVKLIHALALQHQIKMPITEAVFRILYESLSSKDAFHALINRPMNNEFSF